MPTIVSTMKRHGVAEQIAYDVVVDYDGQRVASTFVGQTSGGPVVIQSGGFESFIAEPDRFGPQLTDEWIRHFYGK